MTNDRSSVPGAGWRGLSAASGQLTYRPPSIWWRRPTLLFSPEGLLIVPRTGDRETLAWTAGRASWRVVGEQATRVNRAGIRVSVLPAQHDLWHPDYSSRDVWLPSTWSIPPLEELPSLVEFLIDTPDARPGLADRDRVQQLVRELAGKTWRVPHVALAPVAGDRLDVHIAVERALEELQWRRYCGRPVRGIVPDALEVSARARRLLLPAVADRITDAELTKRVERHLRVGPWPFDVLLP